jgi:hypothetical protein
MFARSRAARRGRSACRSGGSRLPRPARARGGRPSTSRAGAARARARALRAGRRAEVTGIAEREPRRRTASGSRCARDTLDTSPARRSRPPRCRRGARGRPRRRSPRARTRPRGGVRTAPVHRRGQADRERTPGSDRPARLPAAPTHGHSTRCVHEVHRLHPRDHRRSPAPITSLPTLGDVRGGRCDPHASPVWQPGRLASRRSVSRAPRLVPTEAFFDVPPCPAVRSRCPSGHSGGAKAQPTAVLLWFEWFICGVGRW